MTNADKLFEKCFFKQETNNVDYIGYKNNITTGGKGWKHNCSLRLMFNKGDYIDANNVPLKRSATNPSGNLVEIAIAKTKVCKPDRRNGYYTLIIIMVLMLYQIR